MRSSRLDGPGGATFGPAPVTLPDQGSAEDVDRELLDLLCEDDEWVDDAFREIVAASWDGPPRGGAARPDAHPRRFRAPVSRARRWVGGSRSQWWPRPHGRQRSPPA